MMQNILMDSEFRKILEQAEQESRNELQSTANEVSLGMSQECLQGYEQQMKQAGLDLEFLRNAEAKDLAEAQKFVETVRPALILAGGEAQVAKLTSDEEIATSL
jgi:GTP cyclohydrolase I